MKRTTLASRLIKTRGTASQRKLLTANRKLADAELARALKDECYRVWASSPGDAQHVATALRTLATFSPSMEIDAMRFWVEGIANITRGKLETAVEDLNTASKLLRRLGYEHESAQPQVARLIALAMLGRYAEARRAGDNALRIFERHRDQLAAGKIEMNLSNIVSRRDEYRLAEQYCLSAYRRFKRLGEIVWMTMAENGLANTYAELNDFTKAEQFYERALEHANAAQMTVTIAEIEASMGNLAIFRGRYAEAIRLLEHSRQKFETLAMPHQSAIADLEIADIYAELNLNAEAIEIYRRLVPSLKRLKLRSEEARARANLGRALAATDDARAARAELRRAAELYRVEKNYIAAAAVALRQASLELAQRKYDEALNLIASVAPTVEKSENQRLRLSAMWLRGETLASLGRTKEARTILAKTLRESRRLEQPSITQATLNSLGMISTAAGDNRNAREYFEASIREAKAAREPLPGEEFRMAFLAKTLAPYENLIRLLLLEGEIERAFETVESARARSLIEAIGGPATARTTNATKLREELNWFYSRAARDGEADDKALQKEIRLREKKLASIALREQSTAKVRRAKTVGDFDLSSLQRQLGPEKALIEFVEHDGMFSAFVVTNDEVEYVESIATSGDILSLLDALHFQFGALRFGGEAVKEFATQLKQRADAHLHALYQTLLAPIDKHIADRHLVIVPAGALNYVPFHALFDSERYVIESREIVYAPSAAVWQKLNLRRITQPKNALLMSYADERIPLANDEVAQLAKTLPNAARLSGPGATFAAFEETAPRFDLIHLACHGQFRPDNPMFSSVHLADGWVTVRDICARRLKAQLVTLSACETGLNQILAGEEILGLARGFLSAGARSLLLSLWTVNDEATARLMKDFYANLQRGAGVAASLRVAQLNFIKHGQHPYFWAPFFVIG